MTRSFFSNEEYTRVAMTIIQEYPFLKDGKSDSPIVRYTSKVMWRQVGNGPFSAGLKPTFSSGEG